MKCSFILLVTNLKIFITFAQYGSYDFDSYRPGSILGAIGSFIPNRGRTTTRHYSNFDAYQYDPNRGSSQSATIPNNLNSNADDQILSLNSCNKYWTIQRDDSGLWGQLSISSSNRQQAVIKISLSVATSLPTDYVGDISLVKDEQSTVNDISNGLPILYRVGFPVQKPIPKLTAVEYNDQSLCSEPDDAPGIVTRITLGHTLHTGLDQQKIHYNQNPFIKQSLQQTTVTTKTTTIRPTINPFFANEQASNSILDSSQCGVPNYQIQESSGLIINGKVAIKGQFPWLAAYYHNAIGDSGYICGGSLVSSKIVLTAAHCIHNKRESVIRKPEEALIYLGKYYLHSQSNERDFLVSGVTEFHVHSDWNTNSESYDSDIAAIVLLRTIQFTNFIKPICIWTSTQSYYDIVNNVGVVAGYGKTESTITASDRPFWAEIPVVDEGSCLRSNPAFAKITSKRTFCAGGRDERGPCNGDSGSGFIIKSNGKWYLRGIISSALFDRENFTCDTKNYAVFTDAAAFKDWIIQQVEIYG